MPRKIYASDSARDLAKKNKLLIKDIPSKTEKVTLTEVKDYISGGGLASSLSSLKIKPAKSLVNVNFTVDGISQTKKNYELIKQWFEKKAQSVAYGFPLDLSSLKFKVLQRTKGYYINAVFIVNGTKDVDYETTTEAILDPDDDGNHPVTVDRNKNIISLAGRLREHGMVQLDAVRSGKEVPGRCSKEILIRGRAIETPTVSFML